MDDFADYELDRLRTADGFNDPGDRDGRTNMVDRPPTSTDSERYELRQPSTRKGLEGVSELEIGQSDSDATNDPWLASQEGIPFTPPTSHPSAIDDPDWVGGDDTDVPPVDDILSERVYDALRADRATQGSLAGIRIRSSRGVVVLRGSVEDIDDTDRIAGIASDVPGVVEVRDELTVTNL